MTMNHQTWHIAPGVAVLHSSYRSTAAGIVRGSGSALVIDPGLFPAELAMLHELARPWGGVRQLVLTHSHWDRLLGCGSFTHAERIAHANFMPCYLAQEVARRAAGQQSIPEFVRDLDRAHGVERPLLRVLPPTRSFASSLSLDLGARRVELLHTPGHTDDSIAVLLPDDGVLFSGDMLSNLGPPLVTDANAYVQSLSLIQDLVSAGIVHTIVPGHGRLLHGADEIQRLIAADRSYLLGHQQILQALRLRRTAEPALLERAIGG